MERILLLDIDLTLVRTNGAGAAAMAAVVHDLLGIEDAFAGILFAGRSDQAILREALTRQGVTGERYQSFLRAFPAAYYPSLERLLQERGGSVLSGVEALLDALESTEAVHLGLATGNFRQAARIKLEYFDLWRRFRDGGFGEDGEDRADLVAAAIARMAWMTGPRPPVYVLGDSPHDIIAARTNGAIALGVATGASDATALWQAGADTVFEDLADTAGVLWELLRSRR